MIKSQAAQTTSKPLFIVHCGIKKKEKPTDGQTPVDTNKIVFKPSLNDF
jgi:hypothetical protein